MSEGSFSPELPKEQKAAIREFTKSTPEGRQARNDAAEDILGQRSEARQSRQKQRDYLIDRQTDNQQNRADAEAKKVEAENRLLYLKAELVDRSTSWLARARALVSRSFREEAWKLQKQLPELEYGLERQNMSLKIQRETYQRELFVLEKKFNELSRWHKTHPLVGKKTLQKFYGQQWGLLKDQRQSLEEQRQKAELERYKQEHGTVAEVTDRYQGYIVHGITPGFGGANNMVLEDTASWADKLMVIVAERPPLSASFVKKGNGPQHLWSPIGVVIQSGIIAEAEGGDLGSLAVDKKTKKGKDPKNIMRYQQSLERAVAKNNAHISSGWHNEVILEFGLKVGGVYINLDQGGDTIFDNKGMRFESGNLKRAAGGTGEIINRLDRIEYEDIYETASIVGLPVVVLKNGILYESSYDPTRGLTVGRELSPREITASPTEIPNENIPGVQKRANSVLKTVAVY